MDWNRRKIRFQPNHNQNLEPLNYALNDVSQGFEPQTLNIPMSVYNYGSTAESDMLEEIDE